MRQPALPNKAIVDSSRLPFGKPNVKSGFDILTEKLNGLSPLNKLSGGFGYVTDEDNKMIRSIEKVKSGNNVKITLSDGSFSASVQKVQKTRTSEV